MENITKYTITVLCVAVLLVGGCAVQQHIILPNGEKGIVIDCTTSRWSECFKTAGDLCKSGYKIYERAFGEFTESKIPLTELKMKEVAKGSNLENDHPLYQPKQPPPPPVVLDDKYMVISCNV